MRSALCNRVSAGRNNSGPWQKLVGKRSAGCARLRRRAQGDPEGSPGDSMESLFLKELKRRGIDEANAKNEKGSTTTASSSSEQKKDPFKTATTPAPPKPPPSWAAEDPDDQLSRSRALNSEGLEGLIPRATELLKLGGTAFLAFLPVITIITVMTGTLYMVFGEKFVHQASPTSGPPPYIDPELLLNEPTVDQYVPYQRQ